MTPEQIAELRARAVETRQLGMEVMLLRVGKVEALLDAAERCGELERRFANLEMHSCAVAKAADRMRAHEKVQDEMLRAAIARAEAAEKERDRMRPVVEAAVAEYRAADAANDETEPDDTQVHRNGRWAKAETTLHIAVHNYLDGDHAKAGK